MIATSAASAKVGSTKSSVKTGGVSIKADIILGTEHYSLAHKDQSGSIYRSGKTTITVNSTHQQDISFGDVLLRILIRHLNNSCGLEARQKARYNRGGQNVDGVTV